MVYPSHSTRVLYEYNTGSGDAGIDDRISRLSGIELKLGAAGADPLIGYKYLGAGMTAVVDFAKPDIQLDRSIFTDPALTTAVGTRDNDGVYPGWDRFGRVKEHVWVDGNFTTHASDADFPNIPPIFQEAYTYDKASNRLTRTDARTGASWASRDYTFTYDDLHRLTAASTNTVMSPPTRPMPGEAYTLDVLGNWDTYETDYNGNGTFENYTPDFETETRTHDASNQLIEYDPGTDLPDRPLVYDDAGNMVQEDYMLGGPGYLTVNLVHDAWNRLVSRTILTKTSEYEYNALHWRVIKRPDEHEQREMYYDASWRLIEEQVDDDVDSSVGIDRIVQNVFGSRYIDDMAFRQIDDVSTGSSGTFESEWFLLSDVQFSVVAIVNGSGRLYERVRYTPYGRGVHHWAEDADGDGDVNPGMSAGTDEYLVDSLDGLEIDDVGYRVECDLNRDGVIDSTDKGFVTSKGSTLALGIGLIGAQDATGLAPDNHFGYCGYVFNWESDLYTVRFRHYAPKFGRWVERDPVGYVDGLNLFEYVASDPSTEADPFGLCATVDDGGKTPCPPSLEGTEVPTSERTLILTIRAAPGQHPLNFKKIDELLQALDDLQALDAAGKAAKGAAGIAAAAGVAEALEKIAGQLVSRYIKGGMKEGQKAQAKKLVHLFNAVQQTNAREYWFIYEATVYETVGGECVEVRRRFWEKASVDDAQGTQFAGEERATQAWLERRARDLVTRKRHGLSNPLVHSDEEMRKGGYRDPDAPPADNGL